MRALLKPILVGVAFAAAGCNGAINVEGSLPKEMASARDGSALANGALRLNAGNDALVVDSARMDLKELELEGRTEAREFEVGPSVLELGLDGAPTNVAVSDVPAGKYRELGIEIETIVVAGSFNGKPFEYKSGYAAELEFDIGEVRVRSGETATVTLTFDVAAWFLDSSGGILDPSNPDNHGAIDGNIANSVAAYAETEDDDGEDED